MKKYIAVVATAAAAISYGSVANANGTVSKTECPPVHHPHHHHKHHAHHAHHAAPHCPPCPCIRSGFFAGLNGGYGWAKGKLHGNVSGANGGFLSARARNNTTLGADGGLVGVHVGYDHVFHNHAVLGVEAGARWSDLTGHSNFNSGLGAGTNTPDRIQHIKFRTRDEYQLALRVGRVFHQCWLGYGKVGAEWTKLKIQTRSNLDDINGNALGSKSRNKYRTGLLLALGFDTPVTQHFWLGAEYSYTRYQKVSVTKSGPSSQDFQRAKIRPYSNKLVARLTWRQ